MRKLRSGDLECVFRGIVADRIESIGRGSTPDLKLREFAVLGHCCDGLGIVAQPFFIDAQGSLKDLDRRSADR